MIRDKYSIADAAARVGVHPWTLRRLESLGRIPLARRDPLCGARVYDDAAIERIREAIGQMSAPAEQIPA